MMKKIFITGANGLLGQKLVKYLSSDYQLITSGEQEHLLLPVKGIPYHTLDITSAHACREIMSGYKPDIIINAASYTDVDGCEVHRELCWNVNVKGVENLAFAARKNMALLIHLSTDFVFDGEAGPYSEEDKPNPLSYYGKSKLASENIVRIEGIPYAIIRTCVLYGLGVGIKKNFFLWIYDNLKQGNPIKVVTDQFNTPTLVDDLAIGIRQLIRKSQYGLFHMAGPDFMNRFEFARAVARVMGFDSSLIEPITSADLNQKAKRPVRGGLRIDKAKRELGYRPRSVEKSIAFLKKHLTADT